MRLRFAGSANVEPHPRVITIGTYDGVHRGHQHLIQLTIARARELSVPAAVVTFEPVPVSVLRPELFMGRVATAADKLARLRESGLDEVLVVPFDRELAAHTADEFMGALVEQAGLRELWVGEDFALGKGRAGDVERLTGIGAAMGFRVAAIPRVTSGDEVVSSSAIRQAVASGNVDRARQLLGRPFRVAGVVIHGAHLGRTIGYPTANVVPPPELVALADGIYVSLTSLPGRAGVLPSMTYVGTRPTVDAGERLIETHVLDFDDDLYGQTIEVDVLSRLRADQTFDGLEALVAQLKGDEEATRAALTVELLRGRV